jgi:hypothetical protein
MQAQRKHMAIAAILAGQLVWALGAFSNGDHHKAGAPSSLNGGASIAPAANGAARESKEGHDFSKEGREKGREIESLTGKDATREATKETTKDATKDAAKEALRSQGYSGHWEALGHPDGIDFDLRLQQRGAKISGHHMAVNSDGTRIDGYETNEPPSVDGEIKSGGKEVELQFHSSFATTPGKAKIKLRGKRLIWTVTSPPEGNYYLPGEAVLVRTGS